jgi:hypothetical protein
VAFYNDDGESVNNIPTKRNARFSFMMENPNINE